MLKFQLPAYQEIPNVGLYLEQTLKYINDTFSAFRSVELTKSMISNYVKLGYLRRPVKKQYDREQIAALLFIAVSKQVLSMDNIGKLFRMQVELGSMEESYTAFKADFDYLLDSIWNQKVMEKKTGPRMVSHPVLSPLRKLICCCGRLLPRMPTASISMSCSATCPKHPRRKKARLTENHSPYPTRSFWNRERCSNGRISLP